MEALAWPGPGTGAHPCDGAVSGVANLVTDVCWGSAWEPVPEGLQSPTDGGLEIIAPLVFSGNTSLISADGLVKQRTAAESRFFWDNLVAKQSINAFGRARFDLIANAKGQVARCDVTLKKTLCPP